MNIIYKEINIHITNSIKYLIFRTHCLQYICDPFIKYINNNSQQLRFSYTSPGESEHYGSISLTFYPTTSRLLVQGLSYILWVDEHLPAISKRAEEQYM